MCNIVEVWWSMASASIIRLANSVTCLIPRSILKMGHLPPFDFCSNWCKSVKVLLCRFVISLAMYRHPPCMCVILSGVKHFAHMGGGPCFFLHR